MPKSTVCKLDFDSCSFKDLFEVALKFARIDKDKASTFYNEYVQYVMDINKSDRDAAERIVKSNLGYFAGYYNKDVCDIIYSTYNCCHPIFGKSPFSVSPEEAFETGYKLGKQLKESKQCQ